MILLLPFVIAGAFGFGVLLSERWHRAQLERLAWYEVRDSAVDDLQLVREIDKLKRRIAGLLASPRLYLKARRLLAPLKLDRDNLTAELDLIELTQPEQSTVVTVVDMAENVEPVT